MLPDVLAHNLDVIFCGTGAGRRSAAIQQYYAGQGNRFWPTLYDIGLTPRRLGPADFEEVLGFGIGLTDLVKHRAGADSALESKDFVDGRTRLRRNIFEYRPRFLCFNGLKAAQEFLKDRYVDYGLQRHQVAKTRIFVAPSTSSMASGYWNIDCWHELAELVRSSRDAQT